MDPYEQIYHFKFESTKPLPVRHQAIQACLHKLGITDPDKQVALFNYLESQGHRYGKA